MSLYKIHLYWNNHFPGDVIEAAEDDVRHLLGLGLAEPVKEEALDAESDAGRRGASDELSEDASPE